MTKNSGFTEQCEGKTLGLPDGVMWEVERGARERSRGVDAANGRISRYLLSLRGSGMQLSLRG